MFIPTPKNSRSNRGIGRFVLRFFTPLHPPSPTTRHCTTRRTTAPLLAEGAEAPTLRHCRGRYGSSGHAALSPSPFSLSLGTFPRPTAHPQPLFRAQEPSRRRPARIFRSRPTRHRHRRLGFPQHLRLRPPAAPDLRHRSTSPPPPPGAPR